MSQSRQRTSNQIDRDINYINFAITKINLILQLMAVTADSYKQSAILMCLIDLSAILTNKRYKLLSDSFIKKYKNQIPFERLLNIRHHLVHRYYNEVTTAALREPFISDLTNLCRALKEAIVSLKSRLQEIDYRDNNLGVTLNQETFLNILHSQLDFNKDKETSLIKRLLIMESKVAELKNLYELDLTTFTDQKKLIVLLAMEYNLLIISQIFKDFQRGDNQLVLAHKLIVDKITGNKEIDSHYELLAQLIGLPDLRDQLAHSQETRDLQTVLDNTKLICQIHPILLETLYYYGVNVPAILVARSSGIRDAEMLRGHCQLSLLLVDVQHCTSVASNLASLSSPSDSAYALAIANIAVGDVAAAPLVRQILEIYTRSFNAEMTRCTQPHTPNYAQAYQRATQYTANYLYQLGYIGTNILFPMLSHQLLQQYQTIFNNCLHQAIQDHCVAVATGAINPLIHNPQTTTTLEGWLESAIQTALVQASKEILNTTWINQIIDHVHNQIAQSLALLATQCGLSVPCELTQAKREEHLNSCIRTVYLNAYKMENQSHSPERWITDLLRELSEETLFSLERHPDKISQLLDNVRIRLIPQQPAAAASSTLSPTIRESTGEVRKRSAEEALSTIVTAAVSSPANLPHNVSIQIPGLSYQKVPGDGHCLYHAVALYTGINHEELRKRVADYIERNLERLTEWLLSILPEDREISAYIADIRSGKEWADNIEIQVLMEVLTRPIITIGPDMNIINRDVLDRGFTGEPIFVYYNGYTHYDAIVLTGARDSQAIINYLVQEQRTSINPTSSLRNSAEEGVAQAASRTSSLLSTHAFVASLLPEDKSETSKKSRAETSENQRVNLKPDETKLHSGKEDQKPIQSLSSDSSKTLPGEDEKPPSPSHHP